MSMRDSTTLVRVTFLKNIDVFRQGLQRSMWRGNTCYLRRLLRHNRNANEIASLQFSDWQCYDGTTR